jgi:hypothetical protein
VDTFLGLLGVAAFIPAVIALAASITWVVVKVSPATKERKPADSSS